MENLRADNLPFRIPEQFDPLGSTEPAADLVALRDLGREAFQVWREDHYSLPLTGPEFIEIGSWAGLSTLALDGNGVGANIFCIDHWQGSPAGQWSPEAAGITPRRAFSTFCRNMGDLLYRRVFPCVGHSLTYAAIWPRKAQLVYIDADHERCGEDIDAWLPHVCEGGILAGHDYGIFKGVTEAVDRLNLEIPVKWIGKTIWCAYKPISSAVS